METDKAIERLKLHKDWGFTEETMIAIDAGIVALEKQIPKEVIKEIPHLRHYVNYLCPCCKSDVSDQHKYCDECGQAIFKSN